MDTLELVDNYEAMAQATLLLTPAEVARRVRPYVANLILPTEPDMTFYMSEAGVYLSHGYWRILIHPSRDPQRLWPLVELIGELDDKLRECERFLIALEIGDPMTED